jgi:3-hydroxyisobutyrate dehydrogenase-like beta-hydroxyacid dehydrogenase
MAEGGTTRVGFIGLGAMGSRMAANVLKGGYTLTVYNRSAAAAEALAGRAATVAESPRDLAQRSDVVITMVSDPAAVRAISGGPDGLLAGAHAGLVWIDMSTIGPSDARRAVEEAAGRQVQVVHAPVLGSLAPAEKGELLILAGGDESVVKSQEPLLRTMGNSVIYLGPNERPCALKIALNLNLAASLQLLGESLALVTRWGIPREQAVEIIGGSALVSAATKGRLKSLYDPATPASFTLRLARKDLWLAVTAGYEAGASMPLTAAALETFTMATGAHGDEEIALIAAFIDEMSARAV